MKLVTTLIVLAISVPAMAQQIAWNPTIRKPYTAPYTFIGFDAQIGYSWHSARLPYLEDVYNIPCCTYERGTSAPFTVGLAYERWVTPSVALTAAMGMRIEAASFSTNPVAVPRRSLPDLVTKYQLDVTTSWLSIAGGAKYRIGVTPFSLGVGMTASMLLGAEMMHREIVVGPDDYFFVTDPPVKEMQLPTSSLADVSDVVLRPFLSLSYDVPLAYGYYVAPAVRFETTFGSVSQRHSWGLFGISLGVTLNKGL